MPLHKAWTPIYVHILMSVHDDECFPAKFIECCHLLQLKGVTFACYYLFFPFHFLFKVLTFFTSTKLLFPRSWKKLLLNSRNTLESPQFPLPFCIIYYNWSLSPFGILFSISLSDTFLHFLGFPLHYRIFFHCQEDKSEDSCVCEELEESPLRGRSGQ